MEQKTVIKLLKTGGGITVFGAVVFIIVHLAKKEGGSLINITVNDYTGATNCGNSGK